MYSLNRAEVESVHGAGPIGDAWEDIKTIVNEVAGVYETAIDAATDMMCTGSGNC